MKETGLVHDEGRIKMGHGPYVQSERNAQGIYLKYAEQLIEQGMLTTAFVTKNVWNL